MVSDIPVQSGPIPILFTLVIVIGIVALRTRRMRRGVAVNKAGTIGYLAVLGGLAAFFVGESFYTVGVSLLFILPYVATISGAAYAGYRYSKTRLVFWQSSTGSILVKGGLGIFAIYIGALMARISISFLFLGSAFGSFSAPTHVDSSAYAAYVIADFLMMLGAGLFIGRNVRIYRHYLMIQRGEEPVSKA